MTRSISISLILCLLSIATIGNSQVKNDRETMNLKGRVKSIVEKEYQMSDDETADNDETRKCQYTFNHNGQKTEEAMFEGNSPKPQYRNISEYNSKGYLLNENSTSGRQNIKRQYNYDNKHRIISINVYDDKGKLLVVTTQKYDSKNRVKEKNVENKENRPNETYNYQYDDKGYLVNETQCIDTVCRAVGYTYDSKGNQIERKELNKIGETTYLDSYKYDDHNNLIESSSSYKGEYQTALTYNYTYDDKGNWINMREMIDGKTYTLTVREITYY